MERRSTNLPYPPTPLIGRDVELRQLDELLHQDDVPLITLTGTGGSGKTRLALETAAHARQDFRDGVFFVDLAVISDPLLILPAIAQTINVKTEKLKENLHNKQLLLLLDNFEHLMEAAPAVADLLVACPDPKFLITSREVLRLRGEHELSVLPLSLPVSRHTTSANEIEKSPAVTLFVQRAKAVDASFRLNDDNARFIAEICRRLDGLPLAIELAAVRIKLFSPEILLSRLEKRLSHLTSGPRDLPTRQKTLRATLDWSYNLLDSKEQLLLTRLSIFSGGATIEAIQAVTTTDGTDEDELLGGLLSLIEKNLVRQVSAEQGESRLVMLDTIREYALEKLEISEDAEILRRSHAEYFLKLAESARALSGTNEQSKGLDQLEKERGNLREALYWTASHDPKGLFLRLAGALWRFWAIRGPIMEGRVWLDQAIMIWKNAPGEIKSELGYLVLMGASELARAQGDLERAVEWKSKGLEFSQQSGHDSRTAALLHDLAIIYGIRGDYKRSLALAEEGVALRRRLGRPEGLSHALEALFFALMCNDKAEAAHTALEEGFQIDQATNSQESLLWDLTGFIYIAARQGNYEEAYRAFDDSLPLAEELGDQGAIATGVYGMAAVLAAQGQARKAARFLGTAERIAEVGEFKIEIPGWEWTERTIAAAKARLGETSWVQEYQAGNAFVPDGNDTWAVDALHAIRKFLDQQEEPTESVSKRSDANLSAGLTARELEILKLVAQGLTDHQIAETLVLSPRTVNAHLTSIYRKLDVNSRAAATRFAMEKGLV
jgi:predicted ATPase/DNA-binding CsgD family transcriptional regulator